MGVVYFVEMTGSDLIKIGCSAKETAKKRVSELQREIPYPLRVVHEIRDVGDEYKLEQAFHLVLEKSRIRGEWFDGEPVRKMIAEMQLSGDVPEAVRERLLYAQYKQYLSRCRRKPKTFERWVLELRAFELMGLGKFSDEIIAAKISAGLAIRQGKADLAKRHLLIGMICSELMRRRIDECRAQSSRVVK